MMTVVIESDHCDVTTLNMRRDGFFL